MKIMAIPGRSGEEAAIMDFIRGKLINARVPVSALSFDDANRRTPLGGQVGNLVLKLPGTIRGPRRMLSAHVDTVPICVGSRPVKKGKFVVSANKETGLGADDRSGRDDASPQADRNAPRRSQVRALLFSRSIIPSSCQATSTRQAGMQHLLRWGTKS